MSDVYADLRDLVDDERWNWTVDSFRIAELQGRYTVTVITTEPIEYSVVVETLDRTPWRLHPLMTTGRPYSLDDRHVWILTNKPEPEPETVDFYDKKDPSNWVDVVQVKPEEAEEYLEKGYEYSDKWKGLIELTLYKSKSPDSQPNIEGIKVSMVDHSFEEEVES